MEEKAYELYTKILITANHFLHQSKSFSVELLKEENDPSFASIAVLANKLAGIIEIIAKDFDPTIHQKALDYTNIISKMALAIESGQQDELDSLVAELDKKPFI